MTISPAVEHVTKIAFKKARRVGTRQWKTLVGVFVALVAFFCWLDASGLPDYEAYERIYGGNVLNEDWEIFFLLMIITFNEIGLPYTAFRTFVLIFSSTMLCLVLLRFWQTSGHRQRTLSLADGCVMLFAVAVFIFEFYVIRIRAGFATGLIFAAILMASSFTGRIRWLGAIVFVVLAYFSHKTTTVILMILLSIPWIAMLRRVRPRRIDPTFLYLSFISTTILLYGLISTFNLRGEHLASPLNPVRFLMLSPVPLALLFLFRTESDDKTKAVPPLVLFPNSFSRNYGLMAAGLLFIYLAGLSSQSGEAIVRLYTLSSIPALLSLAIAGSVRKAPLSAYLLVINGAFFLATVLAPA